MTKKEHVILYYKEHPEATRKQVQEAVGCSAGLVAVTIAQGHTDGAGKAKAGGDKAAHVEALWKEGKRNRADIAALVECTSQYVGAIIRLRGLGAVKPVQHKPVTAVQTAPVIPPSHASRTGRCEHEKKRKARTGTCRLCPAVEVQS